MIMLWSDLVPGDVLEYTTEYIEKVCPRLPGLWKTTRVFTIREISRRIGRENEILNIKFKEIVGNSNFPIVIKTGADYDFEYMYNGPAFRIVKLAEE